MEKLLIANLKMNLEYGDILEYRDIIENSDITNFIIAPSNIYLSTLLSKKYPICSQNGHYLDKGAFTGEVSFKQLKSLGVEYSLIGHSERRNLFHETDDDIRRKLKSCIDNGITPILCVGEHKFDRENNEAEDVIGRQLQTAIDDLKLDNLIIAYEPVWAIGTGLIPTYEDIMSMHHYIKNTVKDNINNVKVLYGGSVNENNIVDICNIDGVDGVLIGGASNNAENLLKMYNLVNKM